MKKNIIALCLAITLAVPSQVAAQKHRHTPVTTMQVADSTQQVDELEAFSDTTSVNDSTAVVSSMNTPHSYSYNISLDGEDAWEAIGKAFGDSSMHNTLIGGMTILGILLIIFVLAPLVILGLLFYFIYKNRKQKMRLAEEAMKHGQPIPDQLFNEQKALPATSDDLRAKGIRQTCLGVGLMIFLGNTAGTVGFGIGALVTAIGIGNLIIARSNNNT